MHGGRRAQGVFGKTFSAGQNHSLRVLLATEVIQHSLYLFAFSCMSKKIKYEILIVSYSIIMQQKSMVLFSPRVFENQCCKPTSYMAGKSVNLGFLFFPDFKGHLHSVLKQLNQQWLLITLLVLPRPKAISID